MQRFSLTPIVVAVIATLTVAAHAESEPLWSTSGFKKPESVIADSKREVLYVSNVNGPPLDKDKNGFISLLSKDGAIKNLTWIKGLNGPKGMVMDGDDTLYVTDIDQLIEIDLEEGKIVGRYPAEGAIFFNDPAVGPDGTVYVTDFIGKKIYSRAPDADKLEIWLAPDDMMHINGLHVENDNLIVAGWGRNLSSDGSTETPGHLFIVDLKTKEIKTLGNGKGIGNLDGLERGGADDFLVTDFIGGGLYRINEDGSHELLLDLDSGSADLEVVRDGTVAIIPMLKDGKVTAYSIE